MCALSGRLELTLAIVKPHIIKAPHALEVSKIYLAIEHVSDVFVLTLSALIKL